MGRLFGSRTYLCGSIDSSLDLGIGWRRRITSFLDKFGIVTLDPTRKPLAETEEDIEFRNKRHELKNACLYREVSEIMKKIRQIDLRLCDLCDWSIVCLDLSVTLCGTWEELFTLNRSKKPILVYCQQGIQSIPDWLFATLPYQMFFEDWDDLRNYIVTIDDKDNDIDTHRRWQFFDYNKLIPTGV